MFDTNFLFESDFYWYGTNYEISSAAAIILLQPCFQLSRTIKNKNLVLVSVRIDHGNNVRMFGLGNKFDEFDNTRYSDYNHDDVVMKVYECDSVTYQHLGTQEEREKKGIASNHYFFFLSAPYGYYDK